MASLLGIGMGHAPLRPHRMRFRLSVRGALALSTALVRPEREGLRGMMAPANRPAVRRARARAFASVSPRDSLGPQVLVVVVVE